MILANDILTLKDERINNAIKSAQDSIHRVDEMLTSIKPPFNGERLLTDYELSKFLKVSRRTIQEYRNGLIIPYYKMGGKILYKESDIQKVLEQNYCEPIKF